MPKVTVIIPNYNHAPWLEKRIRNVLDQRYTDFELIILDDCSTDDSRDIIENFRSHPHVTAVLFNEQNSGSTFRQWNKGLALARGEYIWIAESDDYASVNFLEKLLGLLDADPSLALAYCKSYRVNEQDQVLDDLYWWYESLDTERWKGNYRNKGKKEISDYLVHKNIIPNASAVLFRKASYEQAGRATEQFRLCGDWFLWMKMLCYGDLAYTVEAENFFRTHEGNVRNAKNIGTAEIRERLTMIRYFKDHKLLESRDLGIMKQDADRLLDERRRQHGMAIVGKTKSAILDLVEIVKLGTLKIFGK